MSQRNQPKSGRTLPPGGREIEVLRLGQPKTSDRDLHVCPSCGSELVQPSRWSQSVDDRVALTLECPNCGWWESGIYGLSQIELLEDRLDEGLLALLDDLHRLTQANMASDIDRFIEALDCDLILPEDF